MNQMTFMTKMKMAGKSVVDAGARTMLKTDIVFLDREIKGRKQKFGIEIYDLMEELESNNTLSTEEKETKIRASFDAARKDIAVISAKKECKKEEMAVLEAESAADATAASSASQFSIPPSSGTVITNTHPGDTSAISADTTSTGAPWEIDQLIVDTNELEEWL